MADRKRDAPEPESELGPEFRPSSPENYSEAEEDIRPTEIVDDFLNETDDDDGEDLFGDDLDRY
jgi:hypothetical protein